MTTDVSNTRLYLIRALFLVNFVLLGADVWPTILNHSGEWDPVRASAFSFWGALSLLSALGLRYPLAMLPLLFLQLVYKSIWLLAMALPQWSTFQSVGLTQAMLTGFILDLIVIPWPFVLRNYVKKTRRPLEIMLSGRSPENRCSMGAEGWVGPNFPIGISA